MQVDIQMNLLTEVKKVLYQTGIRSIVNYLWCVVKYLGMNPPTLHLNTKRYSDSRILKDVYLLKQIRKYLGCTINIYPRESYKFHNRQKFTFLSYFWNSHFAKDPNRMNQRYASLTTKKDALFRYKTYGSKIIMDKAEESNIFKPSFFVLKDDDTIIIAIRGTANSNDKLVDINIKAIVLDDYLVHSGFYQHAEYIYRQLDEAQIFSQQFSYVTTGYSMGGSISCLLAYLIYTKITKNVRSYGFGSGPVGNFLFAQFTQQFTTTVVSGYDFVPHMTMHGLYCQCQRILYENNLRIYKSTKKNLSQEVKKNKQLVSNFEMKIQKYDQSLENGALDLNKMQIYELFDKTPLPAELSLMSVTHLDMFVGGILYHCIKGNLYRIDVHDYSEFYPSQIGFIDHYTYPWMYKYLAKVIAKYEDESQKDAALGAAGARMSQYANSKFLD